MGWNGVKKQTSIDIEAIEAWCEEMGIKNYTINSKGEIDVDGNVDLGWKSITELPYKFGKVEGFFEVDRCPHLISLKNSPNYVRGYFSCSGNINIKSLEGCPEKVGGNFYCKGCKQKFTEEEVRSLCKVKGSINN